MAVAEKISTLLKAAKLSIESYWPSLFAKLCEKKNVEYLIVNVGGGAGAVAAPISGGGGAAVFFNWWYFSMNGGVLAAILVSWFQMDVWNGRYVLVALEWIGMNAMLVYVMAAAGIFAGLINVGMDWDECYVGILLYVVFGEILFWGVVAVILHRFSIY